ncbi:autoinducer binding domain-containing protein, partial [Citrobacter freundii]|uniref:autoinducer binding domain-containing protein n=1 Tax=Citrobacter freundii TaxID=546 RepID=UPI002407A530
TYPKAWVAHYQSENYFAIDPVLKPENFSQGHLPWNDTLLCEEHSPETIPASAIYTIYCIKNFSRN